MKVERERYGTGQNEPFEGRRTVEETWHLTENSHRLEIDHL